MRQFEKLLRYLASRDCGLSAKSIIYRMNDVIGVYRHHPLDASDFGRIMTMFSLMPDYKLELHHMKDVSPEWVLLVDNWDKLEKLHWQGVAEGDSSNLTMQLNILYDSISCCECGKPLNRCYTEIDGKRYCFWCEPINQ